MSPIKIEVESVRLADDDDKRLAALFETFEQESLDNLEKAARELIQLVTAMLTVIFGILALGGKEAAPALSRPLPIVLAAASLLMLLVALIAALDVILPGVYRVRKASQSDRLAAYEAMLRRKSDGLRAAAVCFGVALTAFVGLIGTLLYVRWLEG